jgi:hypothetical protein
MDSIRSLICYRSQPLWSPCLLLLTDVERTDSSRLLHIQASSGIRTHDPSAERDLIITICCCTLKHFKNNFTSLTVATGQELPNLSAPTNNGSTGQVEVTTWNVANTSHYNITVLVNFYLQFFVYDIRPSRDDLWLFRGAEGKRDAGAAFHGFVSSELTKQNLTRIFSF